MNIPGSPFMTQSMLLLVVLGVSILVSVHGLDLHHLSKECQLPKGLPFPSTVKVTLNLSGQTQSLGSDVNKRSLSPWDYSHDVDHNRFPPVIAEAKCRHAVGCVDSEGRVDFSVNSVPIRQEILVLRREMKGCTPTFRLEKKVITVGCTCVRPVTQHVK
ncbi:interleukin-17A-like [Rhinophrynus dorsalis]